MQLHPDMRSMLITTDVKNRVAVREDKAALLDFFLYICSGKCKCLTVRKSPAAGSWCVRHSYLYVDQELHHICC